MLSSESRGSLITATGFGLILFYTESFSLFVTSYALNSSNNDHSNPQASDDLVQCLRTHEVLTGDVPFTIARRYGISPEKLQFMNPSMDVHDLQSKQKLCVQANTYPADSPDSTTPKSTTELPQNETDSLDLTARLCGDFYVTYGYDPALGLPETCKNPAVRNSFKNFLKSNKGFLGQRSRDAWRVNCANPHYCTLCNKTNCKSFAP